MPKYDYKCNICGYVEEIEHSIHEDLGGETCLGPGECDGELNKVFTSPAAHFKGQGWGAVYRNHTPKENN